MEKTASRYASPHATACFPTCGCLLEHRPQLTRQGGTPGAHNAECRTRVVVEGDQVWDEESFYCIVRISAWGDRLMHEGGNVGSGVLCGKRLVCETSF